MHLSIKLVNGEELEFDVTQKTVVVGRSSKCEVVIPHEGVSRQHCQLDFEDGEIFVTDLGSTNGVMIDGNKIEPNQKVPYATYLTLSFGAVQSLSIEAEDTKAGIKIPVRESSSSLNTHSSNATTTRTKVLKDLKKESTKPSLNAKASKKDNKSQQMAVNVLAVLILAAAVWWYLNKEETPETTVDAPVQSAPTKTYDSF